MKKLCAGIFIVCLNICILHANKFENINDDKLLINKSFLESKKIKPRYLFSNVNIQASPILRASRTLSDKSRQLITSDLNEIINYAKNGDICTGGGYSIEPIISYDKNIQNIIGHNIIFGLDCKFSNDKIDEYNSLLANISRVIARNELIILIQPKLNYRLTEEEILQAKDDIFNSFLEKVNIISANYSSYLNKKCETSRISTDNSANYPARAAFMSTDTTSPTMSLTKLNATNTRAPVRGEITVNSNINVTFSCQ